VRVVPELRQKISFHRLNFMDDEYPVREMFEVIFFRNVMIYFSKETQEAVIGKLCRNLIPGGYLFVGHSESLTGLKIPVASIGPAIYRKPL
jgi:chemotaxis protein methyltransferase CheR